MGYDKYRKRDSRFKDAINLYKQRYKRITGKQDKQNDVQSHEDYSIRNTRTVNVGFP